MAKLKFTKTALLALQPPEAGKRLAVNGTFLEMTVEQACGEAQKILGEFATGANPAAVRRAIRQEPTFTEMLADMLAHKKKRDGSPITERTKKDCLDTARLHMGAIANSKLSHITRSEVKAIHTKASKKSTSRRQQALSSHRRRAGEPTSRNSQ